MESILRALVVYAFLMLVYRVTGRRSLSEISTFDLVLTLIISESIQEALIDDDKSMTNSFLIVTALMGFNLLLSFVRTRNERIDRVMEGLPVVIYADGTLYTERMQKEHVDEGDILEAARGQGIASLDDVQYAVLETSGKVTVVPKPSSS